MRKGRSAGPVLAIYTLLALALTYPLLFNLATAVPSDIGDPLLNTWILAWDSHALLTNPLHLFDANIFYPLPNTLAYSEHLLSTALLVLPLQLATGEPIVAYNLALLASFPLAGLGMYLLTLRWTGRRAAAFIAGLIFAFNPYRFTAIAHLQLLTAQWLPFVLLFLDLALRPPAHRPAAPRRYYPALALMLLAQVLASWYLALYSALVVGLYLLFHLAREPRRRPYPALGVTLGACLLLALPLAWPYLALIDRLRQARPLALALTMAAAPADFLAAAPFNRLFGPLTEPLRARPGFTAEKTLFVGLVGPLLALAALAAGRRRFRAGLYSLLAVLILALLLTFPAPYALLASLLPPSTVVRVPARWLIPALFALAGLAARGYAALQRRVHSRLLLGVCTVLLLAETLSVPLPLAPVQNRASLNPAYRWLAAQPADFALVELPLHSAPAPEYPEVKRLYASTLGWWPLVNGYSGYTPHHQPELALALADFPDRQAITSLQNLAALSPQARPRRLLVLVHPGEAPLNRDQWETTTRWQAQRQPTLYPLGRFARDYLYQVRPPRFPATPLARLGEDKAIHLLRVEVEHRPEPRLMLYWQATAPLAADYTVFIHLRAADGFVLAQADGPPVSGHYPTSAWLPGELIQDIHPRPDSPQVDHLAVGLYHPETGARLPASGPDGSPLPDGAVIIPWP